jgi:hypothetical protein
MLLTDKTSRVSAGTLVVLRSNSTATRCNNAPRVRFSATKLGREPEVEVALL